MPATKALVFNRENTATRAVPPEEHTRTCALVASYFFKLNDQKSIGVFLSYLQGTSASAAALAVPCSGTSPGRYTTGATARATMLMMMMVN